MTFPIGSFEKLLLLPGEEVFRTLVAPAAGLAGLELVALSSVWLGQVHSHPLDVNDEGEFLGHELHVVSGKRRCD